MISIGFLLHPGFSPIALAVATAFELANLQAGEPRYDMRMLSRAGGPVRASAGFAVDTELLADRALDLLIVTGTMQGDAPAEQVALVRGAAGRCRRIASICTGAMILAEAGLLDGRRATTHWFQAREMQARFPKIKVEEDRIFVEDGPIWTSAGMTAGLDLALAFIEEECGADLARAVARKLVMYHRRAGGQSQFSALLELEPKSDRIQKALTYARAHLDSRLSVEDLAGIAHLSPRQFSRAFQAETRQSPAKAVEHMRLEAARQLMEDTSHSIDAVARQTGFADRDRMRRAFLRAYGQPPQTIRRAARSARGDMELGGDVGAQAAA